MHFTGLGKTVLIVLLTLLYTCSRAQHRPPSPLPADAPETMYAAERAYAHVQHIGKEPHPAGSAQAASVRMYIETEITRLGLEPTLQETTVYRPPVTAATIQNVLTRIPGRSGNNDAVALMAHYDSVAFGPGAADNGAGVAAMLEAMRAILAGPPPLNDIIFIFTDAKKGRRPGNAGRIGAHAFVEQHPWAEDVRVVINLDARGVKGPSYVYQTSGKNAWLIRELSRSGARSATNSLMCEVYDSMPVSSDLSAFIKAGVPGYDCAFISGFEKYHTQLDAPEHLSLASLQHHGEYALTLARHLADQPLDTTRSTTDVVYFNGPGGHLFYYSNTVALFLTMLTVLAYIALLVFGLRRGQIRLSGFLCALLYYLIWTGAWIGLGALLMVIGYRTRDVYILYSSDTLTLGILLICAGASIQAFNGIMDRWGVHNSILACLLPWILLLSASTAIVPGASFLLTWPPLFLLVTVGIALLRRHNFATVGPGGALLLTVAAVPTVMFMVVSIQAFYEALLFIFIPLHIFLLLLTLGILLPYLRVLTGNSRRIISLGVISLGIIFLLPGVFWPGFSEDQPKFNSITYGLNADTGEAFYMSCDEEVDSWTAQFFASDTPKLPITEFLPTATRRYLKASAPTVALEPPTFEVLEDTIEANRRQVQVRVHSPRGAEVIKLYAEPGTDVLAASVNDLAMEITDSLWRLTYPVYRGNGIVLDLTLPADTPARFRIVDHQYYPQDLLGYTPRPPHFIPKPNTVDFNRDPLKTEESLVATTVDLSMERVQ